MDEDKKNNRRIAKNSLFMSLRMVVVLFISLYTTRVVLRVLGVIDYGVYNVVCGFVLMFAFLNTSMSNGIQRFYNFEYGRSGEAGANKVYCTSIYIQTLLAIIVVIILETLGLWYLHNIMVIPVERMSASEWIFQFAVLSFVVGIMQAPFAAAVTAHEKFDFFAFVSVLDAVLKLAIVFVIQMVSTDRLIIYGFLIALISATNILIFFIYCKKQFKEIHFHRGIDKALFKEMLSFSGWNLFGSFSGVMKEHGINLVLNLFFGPIVNAARGIATQVNAGLQGFVSNITLPVRPQVTQSFAVGNIQRTLGLTFSISKFSCTFLYMMALPLSWELDYILHVWLGNNIPEHTHSFIIIMILVSICNNLNAAISNVVHATGKMKIYQLSTSLIAISSVPLAYIALKLGAIPEWALLMVFITMIFAQAASLIILKRLITFSILAYCKQVLWPLLILFAMTIWIPYIVIIIMPPGFLRLVINVLVSCTVIIIVLYFTGLHDNEKQIVKAWIHKVKNKF